MTEESVCLPTDAEMVAALPGRLDAAETELEAHVGEEEWSSDGRWLRTTGGDFKLFNASQAELVVAAVQLLAASIVEDRALLKRHGRRGDGLGSRCGDFDWPCSHPEVISAAKRWAATGIEPTP